MDLLAGERFSVASYGIGAAYAGWLLREFGAEVRHTTALDPDGIGAFLGQGAPFAKAPPLQAEVGGTLITDVPVSAPSREQVEALSRLARVIWLTPWGAETSWNGRRSTELVQYAAGGWMTMVGEPDREPLAPPGSLGQFIAGLYAAIAALTGHAGWGSGTGLIEVPEIEAMAATLIYDSIAFQYYGALRGRVGNRYSRNQPTIVTLPCKDGYIGIHAALHSQWVTLAGLVGHPELVRDPRFTSPGERAKNIGELDEYLLPWLAKRTRWEVYHELQRNRIPCSAHPDMAEVLASPHLRARGFWREVLTPSGKTLRVPGAPARVRAAPSAGGARAPGGPWRDGALRVVDLSMGWAGPLAGQILGMLGADVIKVESHIRFDWWRGSRPPGDDPSLALYERSHVFNAVNRGKRGITLNLATPGGNDLAHRLIRDADIVIENFGAGIIEKLGLTYGQLSAGNPGLIMLRQPGFGSDGPEGRYVTFGNTIEGMSGLTALIGYPGGQPVMLSNALGDPVSGLTGTIALLSALAARERDGRGRVIEAAQLEGFMPLVSEALIEYQRTGGIPSRNGNRRRGHVPAGAFPCRDGEWVALEVNSDAEWAALSALIGEPWAMETTLATQAARESREAEIETRVATWTQTRGRDDLVAACLALGVVASPVLTEGEILSLEPLVESGFWEGEDRAHVGFHLYPGLPIRGEGGRPEASGPAPTLGEHTTEVLAAMGLGKEELLRLADEGVIGSRPA
ncbi:MAG: CoA transferase [Chloroflexi bacterium]|nr:CoA transferase [Chloroflexota bacterium]